MDANPRPTLGMVLQHLGPMLLSTLAGTPQYLTPVGGVVVHDPGDPPAMPPGAILLGVGVTDPDEILELVALGNRYDAAAVVIRQPRDRGPVLPDEGTVVLGLPAGVAWQQVIGVLTTAMQSALHPAGRGLDGQEAGDLFGMAGAISDLIDASITIEDRNSVVLAYSDHHGETDAIRVEVILGRRTPEVYAGFDEERGAMRAIRESLRPVFLPPLALSDGRSTRGRVAVAVRAGDEILGSIWAVADKPLSTEKDDLLLDASRLVALHMLQLRAGADGARRLRTDLLATALTGGPEARSALDRLRLADRPLIVVALTLGDPAGGAAAAVHVTKSQRVAVSFQVHLAGSWADAAVALLDDTVYALVPARRPDTAVSLEFLCRNFVERTANDAIVGIGRVVEHSAELELSRADADRALRVLARRSAGAERVARASDIEAEAMLLELRDLALASKRGPFGAYARLLAYDDNRDSTFLVDSLRAWLDAHGDVMAAAAATHVHQNTFRYRLKRLSEIGEFSLEDPAARFALQLQLRLWPPDSAGRSSK
ncbi:helix-turn-helix domain-containing protein [Kribbella albertanoniae]|uniref:PucR family transcriptional regulator n=1 Tax=Kribbella albertanoniae TaxID=1266829 RepID=A0A4R4PHX8_9ACTN|nr:helix-turn-helix domain-containing protein [Kribbella albertanoniae]TDC21591.1 PucR family transcriptional regulator [Kribbella albertanoniae]